MGRSVISLHRTACYRSHNCTGLRVIGDNNCTGLRAAGNKHCTGLLAAENTAQDCTLREPSLHSTACCGRSCLLEKGITVLQNNSIALLVAPSPTLQHEFFQPSFFRS